MTRSNGHTSAGIHRHDLYAVASLVLVCMAVYANSLHNPLLRDDTTAVINDRRANDPNAWQDIFTQRYWRQLLNDPSYRPLTTLSFLLNHMVTGSRPWGYRIVNIVLHAAVCVAVYTVGVRLLGGRLGAWLAAMFFAVHAVHTEAVTAIVGRADTAVTLFLLAVVWVLLGRPDRGSPEPWRWAAVLGLTGVGLFCKESAFVVLPLIVFTRAWQWWARPGQTGRVAERRRLLAGELKLALSVAAVCMVALAVRYALFGRLVRPGRLLSVLDNPLGQAEPVGRLLTAIGLLGKYLGLLAWPHPLCCDYSYNQIPVARGLFEPNVLIGLAWVAGIGAALWLIKRTANAQGWWLAVWCLGFFIITYGMIGNVVVVIGTIFGERLIYLPSVAWCLAFGAGSAALARRGGRVGRTGIGTACAAVLVVNAVLVVRRNLDWRDRMTLWQQAVRVCPDSSRCWSNLSKAYEGAGQLEKAVERMEHALEIYAGSWNDHFVLGNQLAGLRRFEESAAAHRRAYELARGRLRAGPAFRLGQCYMELKQPARAIAAFQAALRYDADHALALNNLAYMLATADPPLRDPDAAAAHIERAMRLVPDELILLDTAVDVYLARGQRDRAVEIIRRALSVGNKRHRLYKRLQQRLDELTTTSRTPTRPYAKQ